VLRSRTILAQVVWMCLLFGEWSAPAAAQQYEAARNLVQRVQDDLQRVRKLDPPKEKERERLDKALKRLSDFDRDLNKNKFDKGRLDSAIDEIKDVVENNTLDSRDRDALNADLSDLRRLRDTRGR